MRRQVRGYGYGPLVTDGHGMGAAVRPERRAWLGGGEAHVGDEVRITSLGELNTVRRGTESSCRGSNEPFWPCRAHF